MRVWVPLAALAAVSRVHAQTCDASSFPKSMNGTECWGLQNASATNPEECLAACCAAGPSCQTWQWCPVGSSGCPTPGSCWIGALGNCKPVADWVGGARAGPNLVQVTYPTPAQPLPPMGTATGPGGTITFDSKSLRLNATPWMPLMGELHFARVPAAEWRDELLKVRAAGLSGVSVYVFWIHHEEIQGTFNWSGQRDLRTFLQTAQELGVQVLLRIGPWSHGECRNGGFPDWLQHYPGIQLRTNTTLFMGFVQQLYTQIAAQATGMYWKDGGPIVGIQLDNEYGGDASYLLALKDMAISMGMDAPFYSKTGWPTAAFPHGAFLPFFGGYQNDFWDRQLTPTVDSASSFLFEAVIDSQDAPDYPELIVELGAGMETSYHRRILIHGNDMAAGALCMLGGGAASMGGYMWHGGQNPEGQLSTMQECQATGGANDMPVKSYDFYGAVGAFGQLHPHYHLLRRLYISLRDGGLGSWLAAMPSFLPLSQPSGATDTSTLRWAVRANGTQGLLFINNHQMSADMSNTSSTMPTFTGVRMTVQWADGSVVTVPKNESAPVTIPSGAFAVWPLNWPVQDTGLTLVYATAQVLTTVNNFDGNGNLLVLLAAVGNISGIEVVASAPGGTRVPTCTGSCSTEGGLLVARNLPTGTSAALVYNLPSGLFVTVVVVDDATSTRVWSGTSGGSNFVVVSSDADDGILFDPTALRVRTHLPTAAFSMLPAPSQVSYSGATVNAGGDGVFASYSVPVSNAPVAVASWSLVQPAGPARAIPIGSAGVAAEPDGTNETADGDFAAAAVYTVQLSPPSGGAWPPASSYSLMLNINYYGDAARLYLGNTLLDDNFYNARAWEFGVNRFAPDIFTQNLTLRILPLRNDAPIYVVWPPFAPGSNTSLQLNSITVDQIYDAPFVITP